MVYFYYQKKLPIPNEFLIKKWIEDCIAKENKVCKCLNYTFCSNNYILGINKKYLNHDFYTDIVTLDYSKDSFIFGDCFVSVDQVKENAILFKDSFSNELKRVIIHGALHLMGYKDKSKKDKNIMSKKEDYYIEEYKRIK